jgi:hypothetical protein
MKKTTNARGFSIPELMVVGAIALSLAAFAAPIVQRNWQSYRLATATSEVSTFIQRARFEAIRRNTAVTARAARQQDGNWLVWIDLDRNGVMNGAEPAMVLTRGVEFLGDGGEAPSTESMGYGVTRAPGGAIAFDSRGTVDFGGQQPAVLVIILGYPRSPDLGFRAVTVLPAGRTKVWRAQSGEAWHSQ